MIPAADVVNVLRLLGSAFPTFPLDDTVLATYGQALVRPPFVDLSTLNGAASRWVTTEDRYPTIHQLTDAYQAEARRRMDARRMAEEQRAIAAGVLPGTGGHDPGYAVEVVDVLRTVMGDVFGVPRVHKHPDQDAATCPTCSRADVIAASFVDSTARLLADRGLTPPVDPLPTYACAGCHDRGFVLLEGDRARPCRDCNEAGYDRWAAGHLKPNHRCAECDDLVRGRR